MTNSALKQLKRIAVENRPEACIGCGHENACSVRGCAVVKAALKELMEQEETE